MTERRRMYELSYPTGAERPVYLQDAGNALKICGLLLEGMDTSIILVAPWGTRPVTFHLVSPTPEEWSEFLRISDDPLVFASDPSGTLKSVQRKMMSATSGMVQQMVWVRDGCQCMYCGRPMGEVMLSIDHFVPLEQGGATTKDNLLSACVTCNKLKGDRHPEEFCRVQGYDYEGLCLYLQGRASRVFLAHLRR